MRIAVAGGTGTVGRLVVAAGRAAGHETIVLSRSTGIDLTTGAGLDTVLDGVDTVIDASGPATMTAAASVHGFAAISRTLLAAEARVGVRHHVALSIVGIDAVPKGYGYYQGKLAQEHVVAAGPVPWTLLRATQFHEFARQMFERMRFGPVVLVPRMRSQPVAAAEVAARLVQLAEQAPAGRVTDLAGPRVERMAELARRYGRASGAPGRVVEMRMPGAAGRQFSGGSLLAGPDAQLGVQTFTQWLIEQTGSDGSSPASRPMRVAGVPIVRAPLPALPEPSLSNVRELVAGLATAGMPITLSVEGVERRLRPDLDALAFQALQEGVSVVLTRAPGADATALVRYLPHAVEVAVAHGPARVAGAARHDAALTRSRAAVRRAGGAVDAHEGADGSFRASATIPTPQ